MDACLHQRSASVVPAATASVFACAAALIACMHVPLRALATHAASLCLPPLQLGGARSSSGELTTAPSLPGQPGFTGVGGAAGAAPGGAASNAANPGSNPLGCSVNMGPTNMGSGSLNLSSINLNNILGGEGSLSLRPYLPWP